MVKISDITKTAPVVDVKDKKLTSDNGAWAILFNDEHKFLLAKRGPRMRHKGLWNFFGGRIDDGETPMHAAIRELGEETRVWLKPGRVIRSEKIDAPNRSHYFYVFDYRGEKVRLDWENSEARWVTVADLKAMLDQLHMPTRLFVENFL